MLAEASVQADVVYDYRLARFVNFVTDGGLKFQFGAGLHAKIDLIESCAANPSIIRNARDGDQAHPGRSACNGQNFWYGIDPLNGGYVRLNVGLHSELENELPGGT